MDSYKKGLRAYNKKDYLKAVSFWKPLAIEGNIDAINSMGNLYATVDRTPTCLPEDFSKALYYFRQGTLKGNKHSMYRLGLLYGEGLGVKKDKNKARELLRKAANKRHPKAAYALATSNYFDKFNPDYKEAIYWFTLLAVGGLSSAHFFLADMFMSGKGVKRDNILAYKHLILAGIIDDEELKDCEEIGLSKNEKHYRAMNKKVSILSKELIHLLNPIEINIARHKASEFKNKVSEIKKNNAIEEKAIY